MWQCLSPYFSAPAVAEHYQWRLKHLIEEPLKVVSVSNRSVETPPPQKNKRAIFCFAYVVFGNSLSKEKWEGILLRLLFANSLRFEDREKWLRKLKFIEIYFSGKVGCVSWRVETFLKRSQWVLVNEELSFFCGCAQREESIGLWPVETCSYRNC